MFFDPDPIGNAMFTIVPILMIGIFIFIIIQGIAQWRSTIILQTNRFGQNRHKKNEYVQERGSSLGKSYAYNDENALLCNFSI